MIISSPQEKTDVLYNCPWISEDGTISKRNYRLPIYKSSLWITQLTPSLSWLMDCHYAPQILGAYGCQFITSDVLLLLFFGGDFRGKEGLIHLLYALSAQSPESYQAELSSICY